MYDDFASVYDRLMLDVDYDAWAAHYRALLLKYGNGGKKCVECACGTGALTIPLAKSGLRMTGMDISQKMLEQAVARAAQAGVHIPLVRQDMCRLSVPSRVDYVLATCDGVNYLTTRKRVQAFFSTAYRALKPGGLLVFDVSTPYKLREVLGNNTRTYADADSAYIWNNRYRPSSATVQMALTIFTKQENGSYARVEETQVQRAWEKEELAGMLHDAGFEKVHVLGGLRMTAPREKDTRWHIAAVKK